MSTFDTIGLVAGNGVFPEYVIRGARAQVPGIKVVALGFKGETSPTIAEMADVYEEFAIGQISKPFAFLKKHGAFNAIMAGGLNPKNIFDMRPDLKAITMLFKIKQRNSDTLFTAIVDAAEEDGIHILPSTTFMDDHVPQPGHIFGPKSSKKQLEDATFGMSISKETSRLKIGQVSVISRGTVLAVEALEGTNNCIKRGASLADGKEITVVKVPQYNHDMRFDLPVIGPVTLEACIEAKVSQIAVEAGKTILLEKERLKEMCEKHKISFIALEPPSKD